MTNNHRNPDGSIEPNTQNQDPLLELTQLFEVNSNIPDYTSLNQTVSPNRGDMSVIDETNEDGLDLSFMDDGFPFDMDDSVEDDANLASDAQILNNTAHSLPNGDYQEQDFIPEPKASTHNASQQPYAFDDAPFLGDAQHDGNTSYSNRSFVNNLENQAVHNNDGADFPSFLFDEDEMSDETPLFQQNDYETELEDYLSPEMNAPINSVIEPAPNNYNMMALDDYTGEEDILPKENFAANNPWQTDETSPMPSPLDLAFEDEKVENNTYSSGQNYPQQENYDDNTGYEDNAGYQDEIAYEESDGLEYNSAFFEDTTEDMPQNTIGDSVTQTYKPSFDLEDLSNDAQLLTTPPAFEPASFDNKQQEHVADKNYDSQHYHQENNNLEKENPIIAEDFHDQEYSENFHYKGDYPPDVDTYKFADDIVETTESIDLPEVPYQEQENKPIIDPIKEDFSEIFNIGISQQQTPKPINEEAFYYNGYEQSNDAHNNLAEQPHDYDENGAFFEQPLNTNQEPFEDYDDEVYDEDNYDFINQPLGNMDTFGEDAYTDKKSSLIKKISLAAGVFVVLAGGVFISTRYFFTKPENIEPAIIQADTTPYKIPAKTTEKQNNPNGSEDVYNLVSGSETSPEPKQDVLIDRSETPEDLTAINEQAPINSGPYVNDTVMQDAISAATNHAVPIREVQTVIVNRDGTVLPGTAQIIAPQNTQPAQSATGSQQFNNANIQNNGATDIASIINNDTTTYQKNPTPQPKPQQTENQQIQSQQAQAESPALKIMPVTANTYYVQLSSHPSEDLAQISLNRAKAQFGSIINGLPLTIQSANIPGRGIYYRVRVQTSSRDNAAALCERVRNAGGSCFISK